MTAEMKIKRLVQNNAIRTEGKRTDRTGDRRSEHRLSKAENALLAVMHVN